MSLQFPNVLNFNPIELYKVLIFTKANQHKLYMNPSDIGKFNIDPAQVQKVISNIDSHSCLSDIDKRDSKLFFNRVIQIMKYVDFNEFLSVIRRISSEIQNYLLHNHRKYHAIFLVVLIKVFINLILGFYYFFLMKCMTFLIPTPISEIKFLLAVKILK